MRKVLFLGILFMTMVMGSGTTHGLAATHIYASHYTVHGDVNERDFRELAEKIILTEALDRISNMYNVYFTFDRELTSKYTVDFHESQHQSAEEAIRLVLKGTNLAYQIFDKQFVIIYRDDDAGLESVRQMIQHLQGFVMEKESSSSEVKRKDTRMIPRLQSRSWLNNKLRPSPLNISGLVLDIDGNPLIGVNILVKGSTKGTSTDINGEFTLEDINENDVLVLSYIGYQSMEVPVEGRVNMTITMESNSQLLEEVVVLGYETAKRADVTGSVATVTGRELSKIPVSNVEQAITGRLPGVSVLTTDGAPGAEVVIRVRGGGSVTQDNSPLYVVDGFIVGSIRDIPPTDIETITVLKDAAATAIYGAQASNGVIVITTISPREGKTTVSYNNFFQFKTLPPDRRYEVLSPYEYVLANYEYAALQSDAAVRNFERFYGKYGDLELYKARIGSDWQEELFGGQNLSQSHNLSITGGNDQTKISLSLTRNDDDGIMINSGYQRSTANFKLNQRIASNLKLDVSARLSKTVIDGAGTSGNAQINIKDAVQTRPVNGVADELDIDLTQLNSENDYQSFLLSLIDPVELVKQDWRKRTENKYLLNAALSWEPADGLDLRSTFTSSNSFRENLRFYGPLTGESFNNGGSMPLGVKSDDQRFSYRWLNTVGYNFEKWQNHTLNFILGQEIYSSGGKDSELRAEDFRLSITPKELFANMTFGRADRHSTSESTRSNRFSLFGRVNYQFLDKYMLTLTTRGDVSSRFSEGNRLGIFPALALGWKISEEEFLRTSDVVDELKLRISYGVTGNDRIDATATQFVFGASQFRGPGFNNVENVFYSPSSDVLYNPDLVWETTINKNIGLDFSLFNSRLTGSLDLYRNDTKDLLLQSEIPSNTGFDTQWNNIGSTSNQGVELGLNTYLLSHRNYSLSFSFNFGINEARIEELDGTDERFFRSNWASTDLNNINDFHLEVGGRIGDIYGYVTDGYYSVDDFDSYDAITEEYTLKEGIPNSSSVVGNTNIRPGFLKLKDLNQDGLINADDRQIIGNTLPKFQGGFGFNGDFKGFDFSVFLNFRYGNDIYNTGKIQFNQFRRVTYGNMLTTMSSDNRFTYLDVDGSYTGVPGGIITDLEQLRSLNSGKEMWSHNSFGIAGAVIHSWAVEDGSFLRLNNASIGYSIPIEVISRWGINQFRIFVTGNNLKLWTNYSGYDPEVSTSRSSGYQALTPGVDYSSYPRNRSYTIGLNITF